MFYFIAESDLPQHFSAVDLANCSIPCADTTCVPHVQLALEIILQWLLPSRQFPL